MPTFNAARTARVGTMIEMTGDILTQLAIIDNAATMTMTSREISDLTGKDHRNVLRDIRAMLVELHGEVGVLSFERTQINQQNGQAYQFFELPKRESLILVSGYSVSMRAKIIDRWQELEAATKPDPSSMSRMDILKLAMESEQARILAEEERDKAIATKHLIGGRREATAMATASAARKEAAKLKDQLGFSGRHATILQVEAAMGGDFDFVPLRRWCKANEVVAQSVPDKRYPNGVKAWPAGAWMDCYGVDIKALFGGGAA